MVYEILNFFTQFLLSIIFFVVIAPLSLVVPKKQTRVVFIGREKGVFTDNVKHFFIYCLSQDKHLIEPVFLTRCNFTFTLLAQAKLPVIKYPNASSILYLLTAKAIIIDSVEWNRKGIYHFTFGSIIFQLWHGVPLKEIELHIFRKRLSELPKLHQWILLFQKWVTGRYIKNDYLVTTSEFILNNAFKNAFNAEKYLCTGYPRNDIFYSDTVKDITHPIWLNVDLQCRHSVQMYKNQGKTIYLYTPTFRKGMICPLTSGILNLKQMDTFLAQQNSILIIKSHPYAGKQLYKYIYDNIIFHHPSCDIYPLLIHTDCLITDYSSIFFDYALLAKPIIFFAYDYESYIFNDRNLLFDYDQITPGPKCKTQVELEHEMKICFKQTFQTEQTQLVEKVFQHTDGNSSSRLFQHILMSFN